MILLIFLGIKGSKCMFPLSIHLQVHFPVVQNFKAEHLPVVWSRVLYRARPFLPEG